MGGGGVSRRSVARITYHPNMTLAVDHVGKKVQVGNDQEKAQSERDYPSKNQGGKEPN